MTTTHDVLVLGGGPAGSAAAGYLAKAGYHVALVERAKHPRYQVGESLIPHFWRYVEGLGAVDTIEGEGFLRKAGGTMYWSGELRQFAFKDMGYPKPAMHVERDRFDELLFRHAGTLGVELFEEHNVVRADPSREGCVVVARTSLGEERTFRGRYLIDATGQTGVLAKKLRLRTVDTGFRYIAIWGYFQGSRFVDIDGEVHEESERGRIGPTTLVASLDGGGGKSDGWAWNIQLRKTSSVGLVIGADRVGSADKKDLEQYFQETIRRLPYMSHMLADASFEAGSLRVHRDYSYRTSAFSGPGFLLAGDAGVFVDPIFSQGVQYAFYSGLLASIAAAGALEGRAERAEQQFDTRARQYYELARSLALPNYDPDAEISATVKMLLQRTTQRELELMYVASAMTDRSQNFHKLAASAGLSAEPRGIRISSGLRFPDGSPFAPFPP